MYIKLGETYGSNELISEYIGNGLLDAQFDFNSYYEMRDVLIKEGESSERLAKSLLSSWNWYGNYNDTMANITGNHDNARFMALAEKE